MASEFEENIVSGNVNWSLIIVSAVSLLFFSNTLYLIKYLKSQLDKPKQPNKLDKLK